MKNSLTLALVLSLTACATSTALQKPESRTEGDDKSNQVCTEVTPIGKMVSHLECRPREEVEQEREDSKDMLRNRERVARPTHQ
jgi:hypothetical protein